MALRLAETHSKQFTYVCTPTGNESPEMFAHWRDLGDRLGDTIWPISGGTLEGVIAANRAIPNHNMRFCTRILKIEPYLQFCRKVMPAISYVGLRADEREREGISDPKGHGGDMSIPKPYGIEQHYPLREWGWGLKEVMDYLVKKKVRIPDRTDCEWCFWQRLGEWYILWRDRRESFEKAAEWERRVGHTWRSNSRDTWPASLDGLALRFANGDVPEISLKMMENRKGMCRMCSL